MPTIHIHLELDTTTAITLAAVIGKGLNRGPRHCLPPDAGPMDFAAFNEAATHVVEIGKGILDKALELQQEEQA